MYQVIRMQVHRLIAVAALLTAVLSGVGANVAIAQLSQVEQLRARAYVRNEDGGDMKPALGLKGGEKVVFVTDVTIDPAVTKSITEEIRKVPGVKLTVIDLPGFPDLEKASDIMEQVFLANWYPKWLWDSFSDADIVVRASRQSLHADAWGYAAQWAKAHPKVRLVRMPYNTAEQLASNEMDYPNELFFAISKKLWDQLKGVKTLRITNKLGTDLTVNIADAYWEKMSQRRNRIGAQEFEFTPGHISVSPTQEGNRTNGILVVNALHTGLIPDMRISIKDSQLQGVEGGGEFGKYLKDVTDQFKDEPFGVYPGPGIGWMEEISIGTQPWVKRPSNWKDLRGVARWQAFAQGRARTGAIHISFGNGAAKEEKGIIKHHRDTEMYDATLIADGKVIIKDGHLTALDDPEIRKLASKFGNPDELLKEEQYTQ